MFDVLPESEGRRVFVKASGKLTDADYKALIPQLEAAIDRHGSIRLLVDMGDLEGWSLQAAWDDFAFGIKHWNDFERMALVGDKRWEELTAKAFNRLTKGDIRYFDLADGNAARAWIEES